MPIASLCSKAVVSVDASATLQTATELMKKNNVGSLIVMEGNGQRKPVGILTDRDVALKAFSNGLTASTHVDQIMSKKIVSIASHAGIAEAVDKMENNGVRRIVVKDKDENICGVVSSDDILQLLAREISGIGRLVQKQVSAE